MSLYAVMLRLSETGIMSLSPKCSKYYMSPHTFGLMVKLIHDVSFNLLSFRNCSSKQCLLTEDIFTSSPPPAPHPRPPPPADHLMSLFRPHG